MPTPKKPHELHQLAGTYRRDRHQVTGATPQSPPIGRAPPHLPNGAKRAWRELVKRAPDGVLCEADALAVELAANLVAEQRESGLSASKTAILVSLLSKLGLTPQSRHTLVRAVEPEQPGNPWAARRRPT